MVRANPPSQRSHNSLFTAFTSFPPSLKRRRGQVLAPPNVYLLFFAAIFLAALVGSLMSIYGMLQISYNMNVAQPGIPYKRPSSVDAKATIHKIQQQFEERYGSYSKTLLERGLEEYGSIDATAMRMVEASQAGRPFVMAFSGYSVTVGRGNYFNQSFPFEVQRILNGPMQQLLGIPLVVRNAAIGGIPSYPYSFCLEHFVGNDADVLSWDYSMNEGNGASVLESFVRQAMKQLPRRPMVILLDKKASRTKLLKDYTERGLIDDAIAVGRKEYVLDDNTLEKLNPLPPGFQEWDEFGAPKECPGRGAWHPKRQEHSMIGWIIAVHFAKVLERAYEMLQELRPSAKSKATDSSLDSHHEVTFPKVISSMPENDQAVNELLYGHPNADGSLFLMKDLSCRTSFVPAMDETKTLPSIVVSGFSSENLDIMLDRSEENYKMGWVLDVSQVERKTKRRVERCGGLGYVDMKVALYGIPASGTLRLWLPFEGPSHDDHAHASHDTNADHWFDDLIICEANESREDSACKLDQDIEISVGGVTVSSIHVVNGAAEYLKRRTCVNVGIPNGAQITKLGDVTRSDGQSLSATERRKLGDQDDIVGVVVDITAKPRVTLGGGACCVSHVVWEMQ